MSPDPVTIAGQLLPLFIEWIGTAIDKGKDPERELRAMLDTADTAVDAAEKVKFGK